MWSPQVRPGHKALSRELLAIPFLQGWVTSSTFIEAPVPRSCTVTTLTFCDYWKVVLLTNSVESLKENNKQQLTAENMIVSWWLASQHYVIIIIIFMTVTDPFLFLLLPDLFHQLSFFIVILLQQWDLLKALGTLKIVHLHIQPYMVWYSYSKSYSWEGFCRQVSA